MSRIVFTGDTTKNLGVFYPTPFVQNITLVGTGSADTSYEINTSVVLSDDPEVLFYKNGSIETDEVTLAGELEELHYYIMTFYVDERADQMDDEASGTQYENRLPVKYYDEISNGELNPLSFYAISGSTINSLTPRTAGYTPYKIDLVEFSPFNVEPTEYFNETGQRFLSYGSSNNFNINIQGSDRSWNSVVDLKFIVFSSEIDYFTNEDAFVDEYEDKPDILDYKTSGISYETIYDDGSLGDPSNVVFVDSGDNVYEDTPLLDIEIVPHKIKNITHSQIVDRFNKLLNEKQYQRLYNAENGFDNLKTMMDNISVVLATKKDDPGLLVALQRLISVFPDKAPTKPIGKLYKSFRKNVYTTNRIIKNGERLRKKIIYDSKIIDLRGIEMGVAEDSAFVAGASEGDLTVYSTREYSDQEVRFIPPSSLLTYANDGMFQEFGNYTVACGTMFFDYEKAIRRSTNISRVISVDKLEMLGINVGWKNFRPIYAEVSRTNHDRDVTALIGSSFDDQTNYPITNRVYYNQQKSTGTEDDIIFVSPSDSGASPYFESQPYVSPQPTTGDARTIGYDANNGIASSLVFRQFLDPSNTDGGFGIGQSDIENYRLMSFQLLDFRFDPRIDLNPGTGYVFKIYLEDTTYEILKTLAESFHSSLNSLQDYLNAAQEDGSFNELTNRFNNFFREGASASFESDPSSAPWYTAPMVFALHRDLYYDDFKGNIDEIKKFGFALSQQINPTDGNPSKIETLVSAMEDFYNIVYSPLVSSDDYLNSFDEDGDLISRICLYQEDASGTAGYELQSSGGTADALGNLNRF
tara:strand:+ start:353 stop:2782 length:2430 start_codon:yes stop_codon:yes gene_type:complete